MIRLSVNNSIDIKWVIDYYGISINNEIYNLKTGKKLRQTMVNCSVGYYLNGKFRTLKYIRSNCKLHITDNCPF